VVKSADGGKTCGKMPKKRVVAVKMTTARRSGEVSRARRIDVVDLMMFLTGATRARAA
jgi:hypothetical protein